MKFFKLNTLYDLSLIPLNKRKHIKLRIDDDGKDEQAFSQLKEIENNIVDFINKGQSLFLYSSITGNGKTLWTLRMVEAYFNRIWLKSELKCRVLFISVPRFLLELKSNISDKSEYIEHINNNILDCDLVIWDDIATKLGTEFELSHLLSIIDTRINNGKSNIYTSNRIDDELARNVGWRVTDRVLNTSDVLEFINPSQRRPARERGRK